MDNIWDDYQENWKTSYKCKKEDRWSEKVKVTLGIFQKYKNILFTDIFWGNPRHVIH